MSAGPITKKIFRENKMPPTYAIVGGGISGLYLAWCLLHTANPPHIHIYEKEARLGGRVFTLNGLEMGAGRFNDNHKILMRLINHYQLKKIPIDGKRVFIKDGKPKPLALDVIISKIVALSRTVPKAYLQSRSFEMFLKEHYPGTPSAIDDIKDAFGYTGEFESCNAYDAIKSIELDKGVTQHYIIMGGMSQLVDLLARDIRALGGQIYTNRSIQSWDARSIAIDGKRYDHVFFCVTKPALIHLGVDQQDPYLSQVINSVNAVPLMRVYATYATPWFAWMKQTGRVTTNSPLRHIIPINYDKNIIMIAYLDGKWAEWWSKIKEGQPLQQAIDHNLKRLSWKPSEQPPKLQVKYWDVGVHYWGLNPVKYKQTQQKYTICGEVVAANYKCWVEGALSSVDAVLKKTI